MGRFFNDKIESKRFNFSKMGLIAIGIIFLIIIIMIISIYNKKQNSSNTPTYKLNSKVAMDVGGELPNVEDYFKSIENNDYSKVTVDTSNVDVNKAGIYTVTVKIGSNEELVQLTVGDKSAPTLDLKELSITVGDTYSIDDFVNECEDNSGKECILNYATIYDEDGNEIDQSKYTESGTYEIKIYATDDSGNATENYATTLTIGDGISTKKNTSNTTSCTYGTLSYDTTYYNKPLAVTVGNQTTGCAISYTEWNKESTTKAANEVIANDTAKLKNQVESNTAFLNAYPNGSQIILNNQVDAILNNDSTGEQGLVGYSIYITVYIGNVGENISGDNKNDYLKISYYINDDGTRTYETNAFGIE